MPPTRSNAAVLEHAQQLGLQAERHLADLVEEQRAARAPARSGPACAPSAPVNAPFSWPKSSLSSSVSGIAAQLIATNGPAARPLSACSARANSSLPVPLSPRSSTVVSVGGHASQAAQHVAQRLVLADDVGNRGGAERLFQQQVLVDDAPLLDRAATIITR